MSAASITQVAARAEVSVGTVSNVLNRPQRVSANTRDRVLRAIKELGYVRNEAARSLRSGRSRTVGLLVLDVANPFFTDVARGAEAVADENGAVVTLCNSGNSRSRELAHLRHLEEQRVQGVLMTPVEAGAEWLERLELLVSRGTPVVLVDRGTEAREGCSVAVDDVLGGRIAATHLLGQGHARLAFVGGPLSTPQAADRYGGAQESCADVAGVTMRLVETDSMSIEEGRAAGALLAALPPRARPTAVICANDLLALGLLQAVVGAELRVPQDVAIVGYDDIVYAAAAAVPLSSVRQPRDQLGRTAAQLLFDEINNPEGHAHQQVVFDPELVTRASSMHRRRRRVATLAAAREQASGRIGRSC